MVYDVNVMKENMWQKSIDYLIYLKDINKITENEFQSKMNNLYKEYLKQSSQNLNSLKHKGG